MDTRTWFGSPLRLVVQGVLIGGIVCLPAARAGAQFEQYIAPGELGLPRVSTEEKVETALEEARWRLGPLRLEPWLGVRDVAWVDNVFGTADETVSDLTATAGAGLDGYLPLGADAIFAAFARPEYVWWRDTPGLSSLHGRYGLGLFGYFNRLTVEAEGRLDDSLDFVSAELFTRAGVERRRGSLAVEADLRGPFSLFAGGTVTSWSYQDEGAGAALLVTALDRDEQAAWAGLRYALRNGLEIGLGFETSKAEFDDPVGDRSNSGEGPLVEVSYRGANADLTLRGVYRSLTAERGSTFVDLEEVSGDLRLGLQPGGKVRWALYGARNLVYSALDAQSTLLDTRLGAAAGTPLGWRTDLSLFVESGSYRLRTPGGLADRTDDSLAVGLDLGFELHRGLALTLGGTRTDFDSELAAFDRTVTVLRTGFTLSAGGGGDPW